MRARIGSRGRQARGFTLLEVLVVLAILAILVGFAAPRVINLFGGAKVDAARIQLEQLAGALDLFLIAAGRYPSAEEGLRALIEKPTGVERWQGPYLNKSTVPLDPWGAPYRYEIADPAGPYKLYSFGADRAEGGSGDDADLYVDRL